MSHLAAQLEPLPYNDLRAIATRLGVRQRGQERKAEWVAAIAQFWQTPDRRDARLAARSQLIEARQLPWVLFQADYGTVRRPGPCLVQEWHFVTTSPALCASSGVVRENGYASVSAGGR